MLVWVGAKPCGTVWKQGGGGEVRRRETGQAKKPTGANLLRLPPPIAELTPGDLTGVYYRGITAVLSAAR